MTSAISIFWIFRNFSIIFRIFGNFSFVSIVRKFFIKQLASLRLFWSEFRENPSHPRDYSAVWRFSFFGRALSISHVNYWELWLSKIIIKKNWSFFIDRSTTTTKTMSWRRKRRKDANNGVKTIQNGPTSIWKLLENVPKIVRFRMGALLRIVLKLSD